MTKKLLRNQKGMMLVSIMIITAVLVLIGFSLASFTISQYSISNKKVFTANALMVAEAGIEQAVFETNQDENFTGHETEQVFFDNATQGRGTYTTTITNLADTNAKQIVSTGKVYRQNQNTPQSTRIVKVTIVGTSSNGYSVHTGPGGLILGGSANITNSDVFVNGTISLSGASKIGTHAQPVNVDVAHQSCPTGNNPGPTYPSVCTNGQPISLQQSTFIYGSVCATNQTSLGPRNGGNILPGSTGQGLILGCKADPVSPPTYNRTAHLSSVTTTSAANNNTYVCNQWPFERTWPANLRLNGNVNIGSSCDITINGNAYITGDLSIGGASKIRVSNSVGTNRPVVMVDGKITVNGSAQMIANDSGTGIQFISFKSAASCGPNCTTITGTDLKNSQNLETVLVNGGVNLPGMIFQAYWGKATIGGSGSIGAAAGQTVDMSGAGTVTFGTELSSGVRTWTITSYQQAFPE
jgi:Tfp pilus assembly protein PilX